MPLSQRANITGWAKFLAVSGSISKISGHRCPAGPPLHSPYRHTCPGFRNPIEVRPITGWLVWRCLDLKRGSRIGVVNGLKVPSRRTDGALTNSHLCYRRDHPIQACLSKLSRDHSRSELKTSGAVTAARSSLHASQHIFSQGGPVESRGRDESFGLGPMTLS